MLNLTQALEITGLTHSGLVREHNEDAIGFDAADGFVVLADGMGGYNAGEVASGIAVEVVTHLLREMLPKSAPERPLPGHAQPAAFDLLSHAIHQANLSIYGTAQSQPQCAGMGTTVVATLFFDNRMVVAHVGDSRLYRLRDGVLVQVTRDHSLLQEQLDSGLITEEEARYSANRNLVTRAVGIDPDVNVELHEHAVIPGDLYLFCSDGLSDMLEDADIADTLSTLRANLPVAAEQLVQMANDAGGRDNISVILVAIKSEYPAPGGLWSRLTSWLS
ncbi:Serine/threonine phosphatase stp [Andreprevotia sp. IGB-42]|uniref:Stp1/IreP family PP2C-type Ser/Thr phosphatase n=1 Tax=Andreprevotia sp. IGB-42 TaxID=2497473 RepID=UPI0013572441|nr:Stp1/IreP family PP2C-type Ser/Thr phosphatase [Andreprevotia sp. IGB-42]KAF0813972.1 Serine/threonine phosphatase stp [Andreprevotia sp. IGB-42]